MFKFSVNISPYLIPMVSMSSWIVFGQSLLSSQIFSTFLSFCRCLVILNIDLQLTLDWPCNMNAIQKPLSGLKNVLQKPHEAIRVFGNWFTELHAKLDLDTLLDFAIHHRQKETPNWKSTCVKTMCVQCGVTWRTDAVGLWKCDLGLPSSLKRGSYNNNSPGTFQYHVISLILN
jgi:hypothetical protein